MSWQIDEFKAEQAPKLAVLKGTYGSPAAPVAPAAPENPASLANVGAYATPGGLNVGAASAEANTPSDPGRSFGFQSGAAPTVKVDDSIQKKPF